MNDALIKATELIRTPIALADKNLNPAFHERMQAFSQSVELISKDRRHRLIAGVGFTLLGAAALAVTVAVLMLSFMTAGVSAVVAVMTGTASATSFTIAGGSLFRGRQAANAVNLMEPLAEAAEAAKERVRLT